MLVKGINYARKCSECGRGMNEGYVIGGGSEHYCSDYCLHKHVSAEEFLELYDDGDGDSYYTEWEDRNDWDEDGDNARLIAAAPDLLAALEDMLNLTLDEDDIAVSSRITKARAAIAKARESRDKKD